MEHKQTDSAQPSDVGIVSMECYFPKLFISQSEYETYNKVGAGKYTIGLGQQEMAFTTDREDICSISLTVLSNLVRKNNISYSDIGWICVATETIIDHSKSISSMMMQLFKENGNTSIEGIDVKHACYGGTFALFTAFDRVTSKYWDGKYCVVISADIAEYAQGPARPSGGCGAVALLIGEGGCIDLNVARSSYKAHEYDFYKPHLNSPFPEVDGRVSNACYLNAFDSCFKSYREKMGTEWRPLCDDEEMASSTSPSHWVFHAPYNKLVRKTFGRVVYLDFLSRPTVYFSKYKEEADTVAFLRKYEATPCGETINNREVIKGFERLSAAFYDRYVSPSTVIPRSIGNCYTASIFMGLVSLIVQCAEEGADAVMGKTVQMFSYGSGTVASLYSLRVLDSDTAQKALRRIVENNDIHRRFKERLKVSCDEFENIMDSKQQQFHSDDQKSAELVPRGIVDDDHFFANTYYLVKMDGKKQRFYAKFDGKETSVDLESVSTASSAEEKERDIAMKGIDSIEDDSLSMLSKFMDKLSSAISSGDAPAVSL